MPAQIEPFETPETATNMEESNNPLRVIADQLASLAIQHKDFTTKKSKENKFSKNRQVSEEYLDYHILCSQFDLLKNENLQII